MAKPKHILLISPQPFFQARGTPINVREMLFVLSNSNYKVTLLAYPFGDLLEISNVEIIRSYKPPFINSIKVGPSYQKIILDIFLLLKAILLSVKNKYSCFHGIEEATFISGFLGILLNRPFIADVDSAMSCQLEESGFVKSKQILKIFEKFEGFFFSRASAVITVCESLSNEVKRISADAKIFQIEDFPLDDEDRNIGETKFSLKSKFAIPDSRKIVLYAGNFELYQGIDLLIDSFAKYLKKSPVPTQLVLIGGTQEHIRKYNLIVDSLHISAFVTFTGVLNSDLMDDIHRQADLLVSPRLTGTNTPLKIYSYMNSGTAILATNIYSHTQVLTESSSYLAEPTSEKFSEVLFQALIDDDQNVALRKNKILEAKSLVENKYSRKCFKEKLLNVYKQIFSTQP